EVKIFPLKTPGDPHVESRSRISDDLEVAMIGQGPVPFCNFSIAVDIDVFHITGTPVGIYFGLIGHVLSFGLDESVGLKSPDLSKIFSVVPVVDESVFISVVENLRPVVPYAELHIVGKIAVDHLLPSDDEFKSPGGYASVVGRRRAGSEGIGHRFLWSKHVGGLPAIHINSHAELVVPQSRVNANVRHRDGFPGQMFALYPGSKRVRRPGTSDDPGA